MGHTVLVPIANGTEELEAIAIIDILRRGGSTVTVASVGPKDVLAAQKSHLVADCLLEECIHQPFDMVVLPGGDKGASAFRQNKALQELVIKQNDAGKWVAAICAAPAVVLDAWGIPKGRKITCYPSYAPTIQNGKHTNERVVVDGNLITSQAPGTAVDFALSLVQALEGEQKAKQVRQGIIA